MAVATQTTAFFLTWLAARLVGVYGENENTDFVLRLKEEAARAATLRSNLAMNTNTYVLTEINGARDSDGKHGYQLRERGRARAMVGQRLWLTEQEAVDLARQLDAPIDYFND